MRLVQRAGFCFAIGAAVFMFLGVRAKGADLDPAVLLELAKAKRLREAVPVVAPVKTVCGCATTGKCTCYVGECQCAACGFGAAPAKKVSPGMKDIGAHPADTSLLPGKERGSSDSNPAAPTSTNALSAYQLGGTSGCASGNCPSSTTTGRFRRR